LLLSPTAPSGWNGLVFALLSPLCRSQACAADQRQQPAVSCLEVFVVTAAAAVSTAARRPSRPPLMPHGARGRQTDRGQQNLCRQALKLPGRPGEDFAGQPEPALNGSPHPLLTA